MMYEYIRVILGNFINKWTESSLILKIILGLIIGAVLGVLVPQYKLIGLPGELFVSALKAIAPILVLVLFASAISKASSVVGNRFKTVIILYLFSTFLAAMVAVTFSFLFPVEMHLTAAADAVAPTGMEEIVKNMLLAVFSNPLKCLIEGNIWEFYSGQ